MSDGERIEGEFHYAAKEGGLWHVFRQGESSPINDGAEWFNTPGRAKNSVESHDETARHFYAAGKSEERQEWNESGLREAAKRSS